MIFFKDRSIKNTAMKQRYMWFQWVFVFFYTPKHGSSILAGCPQAKSLPGGTTAKEFTCHCRKHDFDLLGLEDTLEEATHSSILSWRIPWTEEPVHKVHKELDTTEHAHTQSQVKFPKVFIQISIFKNDSVIKIRGNRNQVFGNYY